jgi:hypothetical protein
MLPAQMRLRVYDPTGSQPNRWLGLTDKVATQEMPDAAALATT